MPRWGTVVAFAVFMVVVPLRGTGVWEVRMLRPCVYGGSAPTEHGGRVRGFLWWWCLYEARVSESVICTCEEHPVGV